MNEIAEIEPVSASALPVAVQQPYTSLISLAVEKGTDIAQLEKLMDLEDRWDRKQAKKAYLAALSSFQSRVPVILKKGHADYGPGKAKYDFGKLEDITEAIKPFLFENLLSYSWATRVEAGVITVTCTLSHADGHSESTEFSSTPDNSPGKNAIQQTASAMSYMKRYTLTNITGVTVSGEDDDAQTALMRPISTEQALNIKSRLESTESDVRKFCAVLSIGNIDMMPSSKYAQADRMLTLKEAQQGDPSNENS